MGRRPLGDRAMTSAERVRRHRLKHAASKPEPKPEPKSVDPSSAALAAELVEAKARIASLEAENARLKAREPKPQTQTEAERTIARLSARLQKADAKARTLRDWATKSGIPQKGGMSFAAHSAIVKALHPDRVPSPEDRAAALLALNAWSHGLKGPRR